MRQNLEQEALLQLVDAIYEQQDEENLVDMTYGELLLMANQIQIFVNGSCSLRMIDYQNPPADWDIEQSDEPLFAVWLNHQSKEGPGGSIQLGQGHTEQQATQEALDFLQANYISAHFRS